MKYIQTQKELSKSLVDLVKILGYELNDKDISSFDSPFDYTEYSDNYYDYHTVFSGKIDCNRKIGQNYTRINDKEQEIIVLNEIEDFKPSTLIVTSNYNHLDLSYRSILLRYPETTFKIEIYPNINEKNSDIEKHSFTRIQYKENRSNSLDNLKKYHESEKETSERIRESWANISKTPYSITSIYSDGFYDKEKPNVINKEYPITADYTKLLIDFMRKCSCGRKNGHLLIDRYYEIIKYFLSDFKVDLMQIENNKNDSKVLQKKK